MLRTVTLQPLLVSKMTLKLFISLAHTNHGPFIASLMAQLFRVVIRAVLICRLCRSGGESMMKLITWSTLIVAFRATITLPQVMEMLLPTKFMLPVFPTIQELKILAFPRTLMLISPVIESNGQLTWRNTFLSKKLPLQIRANSCSPPWASNNTRSVVIIVYLAVNLTMIPCRIVDIMKTENGHVFVDDCGFI